MAHGLLYMDEHNNTMPFYSPSTTVVTVAPPSRTSWSNLQVEYDLMMSLHKNLHTYPDKSFSEIVKISRKESGLNKLLENYKTHIPKSFGIQRDYIANKLLTFEEQNGEKSDPYYGIWWLDDEESPLNLLVLPEEFQFPKIDGREMYYFSDILETLQRAFKGHKINILDYSCSSCVHSDSSIVKHGDERLVRRLSKEFVGYVPTSPKKRQRTTLRNTPTSLQETPSTNSNSINGSPHKSKSRKKQKTQSDSSPGKQYTHSNNRHTDGGSPHKSKSRKNQNP